MSALRITCPSCGTQYEVPGEVIPPEGRDVKCSNCETVWFQAAADSVEEPVEVQTPEAPEPAPETSTDRDPVSVSQPVRVASQVAQKWSPVSISVEDRKLVAIAPTAEKRQLAPKEYALRLAALRDQCVHMCSIAENRQIGQDVQAAFTRYRDALGKEPVSYILLDGPMAFIRGASEDDYVMDALDKGIVEGWRMLVQMHDALRPFMQADLEAMETVPENQIAEDTAPELGIELTDEAVALISSDDVAGAVDEGVVEALTAIRDYFEAAQARMPGRASLIKRGLVALTGMIGGIVATSAAAATIATWAATPEGQIIIGRLVPLFERLMQLVGL